MRSRIYLSIPKNLLLIGAVSLFSLSSANAITLEKWETPYNINPLEIQDKVSGSPIERQQGIASSTSIGNARRTYIKKTAGEAGDSLKVNIQQGQFSHSLDSNVTGTSQTIWDGTSAPNGTVVDHTGFNGIDFTLDGGNAIILNITNTDLILNTGKIVLSVYTTTGDRFDYTFSTVDAQNYVDNDNNNKTFFLTIPFTEFALTSGTNATAADFKKVGAISLTVDGESSDLDVTLTSLTTNGSCTNFVPTAPYVMGHASEEAKNKGEAMICCLETDLDQCGICGGDDSSCSDCRGIPNGDWTLDACRKCLAPDDPTRDTNCTDCAGIPNGFTKKDLCGECELNPDGSPNPNYNTMNCWTKDCKGVPGGGAWIDACGVCNGDGWSCRDCAGTIAGTAKVDDCGVCDGGNKAKDKCGVCFGDNKSCADCAGQPYGKFKLDDCGVCLDPYSPEWNTGASVFGCSVQTNAAQLDDVDKWITQQRKQLSKMLRNKSDCRTDKRKRRLNSKALSVLRSARATIKNYPITVTSCSNASDEYCVTSSLAADNSSLTDASEDLLKQTRAAIRARKRCIANSKTPCERVEGCLDRLKKRLALLRRDRRDSRELRDNSLVSISNLPYENHYCSCIKK
ncbi:MAG: hypothetical protein ACOX2O_02845 [Bdellovibrionota bacterium]